MPGRRRGGPVFFWEEGRRGSRKLGQKKKDSFAMPPDSGALAPWMLPPRWDDSTRDRKGCINKVGDRGGEYTGHSLRQEGAQVSHSMKGITRSTFVDDEKLKGSTKFVDSPFQKTYRRGASLTRRGAGSHERRRRGDAERRLHFAGRKLTSGGLRRGEEKRRSFVFFRLMNFV